MRTDIGLMDFENYQGINIGKKKIINNLEIIDEAKQQIDRNNADNYLINNNSKKSLLSIKINEDSF